LLDLTIFLFYYYIFVLTILRSAIIKAIAHYQRGVVIPQKGKTRITIYIDDEILEAFRERAETAGKGYQTMMNEALKEYLAQSKQPLDQETLRRVLQEELRAAL
jgi:uncharacterized protein (DUF4415 family)